MPYLTVKRRIGARRLSGACPEDCDLDFRGQCIPYQLYQSVNYDIAKEHYFLEEDANQMANLQAELLTATEARHQAIVGQMDNIRYDMASHYSNLDELYKRSALLEGEVPDYDAMVAAAGGTCRVPGGGDGGGGLTLGPGGAAGGSGGSGGGAGGSGAPADAGAVTARPAWHYAVGAGALALALHFMRT